MAAELKSARLVPVRSAGIGRVCVRGDGCRGHQCGGIIKALSVFKPTLTAIGLPGANHLLAGLQRDCSSKTQKHIGMIVEGQRRCLYNRPTATAGN